MFTSLRYESLIKEQPSGREEERRGEEMKREETKREERGRGVGGCGEERREEDSDLYFNK